MSAIRVKELWLQISYCKCGEKSTPWVTYFGSLEATLMMFRCRLNAHIWVSNGSALLPTCTVQFCLISAASIDFYRFLFASQNLKTLKITLVLLVCHSLSRASAHLTLDKIYASQNRLIPARAGSMTARTPGRSQIELQIIRPHPKDWPLPTRP